MAIRFDIDKYNVVREQYLKFLCDEKQIDIKYTQLFEIYKTYWANDPEVKAAEKAQKERREQEEEERWRIRELRKELRKEELQLEKEAEQRLADTKANIYAKYGRFPTTSAKRTQPIDSGSFMLTNGLWLKLDKIGDCTNLDKVKSFTARTRSKSVLDKMQVRLRDAFLSNSISTRTFEDVDALIRKQKDTLVGAYRNRKSVAIGHNHFFDVAAPPRTASGKIGIATAHTEKQTKPIKHYSVHTCRGGLPSLGKRR